MQSKDYNNDVVNSATGEIKDLLKKAEKELSNPKVKNVTIASFHEGETVELKGIKFKISSNNQKAKRLTLKML